MRFIIRFAAVWMLAWPWQAPAGDLRLMIEGSNDVVFFGQCTVIGADGIPADKIIAGRAPLIGAIEAQALTCVIRTRSDAGYLGAKLLRDGVPVAAAETYAARGVVKLRSEGPWGRAYGLTVR